MYKSIPISYSVFHKDSNPIFGENTTIVSIEDEAGGGFIVLTQSTKECEMRLKFDKEDLEEVFRIANKLLTAYNGATENEKK